MEALTRGQVFERGESSDFWIGAELINLVVAELAAVLVVLALWLVAADARSFNVPWGASMVFAVGMPMLFYPLSRLLWLARDLHFRPTESGDQHSPELRR